MTTMEHSFAQRAHETDAITTAARVRVYDSAHENAQMLGFNCRAEDFLNVEAIGNYLRGLQTDDGAPLYTVSELQPKHSADKPFVTAAYEVRPPLSEVTQAALGHLLVDGVFLRDPQNQPEGVALIDNTGRQQPDHPLDSGRYILARTPPATRR